MLNISRKIYLVFATCIALIISASSYASMEEIACSPSTGNTTGRTFDGVEGSCLELTFDGVRATNFTHGLITKDAGERDDYDVYSAWSKSDYDIAMSVHFHVRATCSRTGRKYDDMKPGMTLSCEDGESILVTLFEPNCSTPHGAPDKWGVFNLNQAACPVKKPPITTSTTKVNATDKLSGYTLEELNLARGMDIAPASSGRGRGIHTRHDCSVQ